MKSTLALGVVILCALAPRSARADEFYVDPATGSMSNDGSSAHPWSTLEEVIAQGLVETRNWAQLPYAEGGVLVPRNPGAPIKAGDTIWLRSGYHGAPMIDGAYNEVPITIAAEDGQVPTLARLRFRAASGWVVRGLSISPSHAPSYTTDTLVSVEGTGYQGPSSEITIEDCELYSVSDSSAWSDADWNNLAPNGVSVGGDRVVVRGNHLLNVNFGISVSGADCVVEGNVVENFSGDGMRGLGDNGRFEGNTIKNCYNVNANHDDGFQSWSVGDGGVGTGEVRGIVLRGNLFINYEDPDQPYRGTLQGIGCFDGFFVDWVVENNVVITDHWHGITLMGARDCRIVNNTVIDRNDTSPGPPWIQVTPHKDGRPSENILVRNNLATDFSLDVASLTEDHNIEVSDLAAFFVAPPFDLHLVADSAAVNSGSPDQAPATDFDGVPRPQDGAFDVGAYEYHSGPIDWPDAGAQPDAEPPSPGSDGGIGPDGAVAGPDGGAAGADAAGFSANGDLTGCACRTGGPAYPAGSLWLAGLCALLLRRRRRAL